MWHKLVWLSAIATAAGCAQLRDYRSDAFYHHRAAVAFHAHKVCLDGVGCRDDYAKGWKRGYFDVATGGNGAPPPLPEEHYWSVRYQSPSGHASIQAWYNGFQAGAIAADQDGLATWYRVPTAPNYARPWGVMPPAVPPSLDPRPYEQVPTPAKASALDSEIPVGAIERLPALEPSIASTAPTAPALPPKPTVNQVQSAALWTRVWGSLPMSRANGSTAANSFGPVNAAGSTAPGSANAAASYQSDNVNQAAGENASYLSHE